MISPPRSQRAVFFLPSILPPSEYLASPPTELSPEGVASRRATCVHRRGVPPPARTWACSMHARQDACGSRHKHRTFRGSGPRNGTRPRRTAPLLLRLRADWVLIPATEARIAQEFGTVYDSVVAHDLRCAVSSPRFEGGARRRRCWDLPIPGAPRSRSGGPAPRNHFPRPTK